MSSMTHLLIILQIIVISKTIYGQNGELELSVIHINDFHARYEPMAEDLGFCKKNCIGGFSRLYETVMNEHNNSILLNAGDNFFGSAWYNEYKTNITQYFLNMLPFDAYTLGNHEFEDGLKVLIPYLDELLAPVVVANLDDSKEPSMRGRFQKSVVVERFGYKIGIIGVLTSETKYLADVGNLVFLDEFESVNKEAKRLVEEEDVFTNIVISHCGYNEDVNFAKKLSSKVGLIVGGHSHTFLYSGDNPPGPDIPYGPYPTVVVNEENKTVLVVQASCCSKYIGNLTVCYNSNGEVIDWFGQPIYLGTNLPESERINNQIEPMKTHIHSRRNYTILGHTMVELEMKSCSNLGECLLGNMITDAMVFWHINIFGSKEEIDGWTPISIAIINSNSLRRGLTAGEITAEDLNTALPFNNTFDSADIKGEHLLECLEYAVQNPKNYLQFSGIHVTYDLSLPVGKQISAIKLRCQKCLVPIYEPLEIQKTYRIIVNSYLGRGASGNFPLFAKYLKNVEKGNVDLDVVLHYLQLRSPIFMEKGERINVLNDH